MWWFLWGWMTGYVMGEGRTRPVYRPPFNGLSQPTVRYPAGEDEAVAVERYRQRLCVKQEELDAELRECAVRTQGRRWPDERTTAQWVQGIASVALVVAVLATLARVMWATGSDALASLADTLYPSVTRSAPTPHFLWLLVPCVVLVSFAMVLRGRFSQPRSAAVAAQRQADRLSRKREAVCTELVRVEAYQRAARTVESY